jgi:hypothetical protein
MEEPMRKLALAPILLLCLAATPAASLSDKPYITATDVDFPGLLPPPPAETSPAGKRDLQTILDLEKNMTPERMAAIQRDLDQTVIGNPAHDLICLGLSLATAARGSDLPGVNDSQDARTNGGRLRSCFRRRPHARRFERFRPDSVRVVMREATSRSWKQPARELCQYKANHPAWQAVLAVIRRGT